MGLCVGVCAHVCVRPDRCRGLPSYSRDGEVRFLFGAAAISVTGGEYSVNGGAYTSAAGTVNNGDTVTVRHTHSAGESTRIDTVVTIGGVSATFSSVTASATNGGGGSIGLWLLAWLCLFVGVVPLRRRFR